VPAAEPVVSTWRERFDGSAAYGMPAHITALYPFLPADRLTGDVVRALRELCAKVSLIDVQFRRTARFPGVLYLDPEPSAWIRELTTSIAERWPDAPPYGGGLAEIIPHLTVAQDADDRVLDDIESGVVNSLPVSTRLVEACLFVFDGERWRRSALLPFQGRRDDG
jgi:2'-5' RNA ligase